MFLQSHDSSGNHGKSSKIHDYYYAYDYSTLFFRICMQNRFLQTHFWESHFRSPLGLKFRILY